MRDIDKTEAYCRCALDRIPHIIAKQRIVNLGCGICYFESQVMPDYFDMNWIGVDSDRLSLELAIAAGVAEEKLVNSDVLNWLIEQEESSIGMVFSSWVFHNWSQEYRKKVFSQLRRVMRSGAIFFIVDKIRETNINNHLHELTKQIIKFSLDLSNNDIRHQIVQHYIEDNMGNVVFCESELEKHLQQFSDFNILFSKRTNLNLISCIQVG